MIVLYRSDDLTVDDPAFEAAVTESLDGPAGRRRREPRPPSGARRRPQLVSEDRHATYAVLTLAAATRTSGARRARRDRGRAAGRRAWRRRSAAGSPINRDINDMVSSDIAKAEMISLPILAVLLVVIFGSLAAASLPLAIGGVAILGAFTALRGFAQVTDVSIFAVNVVTIIGLGLAIDYGLFMVSRFREELRRNGRGRDGVEDALARTMATAGRTVAVSGVTVAISLAGLLIFPQVFLRSMGFGGMSAVLIAMVVGADPAAGPAGDARPEGRLAVPAPAVPPRLPPRPGRGPPTTSTAPGPGSRTASCAGRSSYTVGVTGAADRAGAAVPAGGVRRGRRAGAAGRHGEPRGRRDPAGGLPAERVGADPVGRHPGRPGRLPRRLRRAAVLRRRRGRRARGGRRDRGRGGRRDGPGVDRLRRRPDRRGGPRPGRRRPRRAGARRRRGAGRRPGGRARGPAGQPRLAAAVDGPVRRRDDVRAAVPGLRLDRAAGQGAW